MAIKDSGKREQLGGMVRDTSEDKVRYDLVFDGPMFERWAKHLTDGAKKYEARNWTKAYTEKERERFRESAVRHFIQWLRGDTDEDNAAAVFFNINGHEHVKEYLASERRTGPKDRRHCNDEYDARLQRNSLPGRRATDEVFYASLPECE